ncbi:MAG: ComEC/Rec2 family competence protein, partial [Candidatus Peribacteraceae bacterium]|nr:ComEC/Rec2 family competence protein [Candidatus Peribacteraceae bacterium]
VSPVANLLVAPLIPFAMLTGFAAVTLSAVWLPLARIAAAAAWAILHGIVLLVQFCAAIPFASLPVATGPLFVAGWYALLAGSITLWKRHQT